MNKNSISSAVGLAAFSLAAFGLANPSIATHRCEDYGLKPVGLYVEGQSVNNFVTETRKAGTTAEFVTSLGIDLDVDELAGLLTQINKDPATPYPVPAALQGPAGFATIQLLQRLIFVDEGGNPVAEGGTPIAEKVLYGKIRDYIYIQATGHGHISVDTCTDDRLTGQRELYHWDVEVRGEGFTVTQRNDADPQNPFPGLTLPDGALDPNNSHSIWVRGLDHKLGARGTAIRVHNVYHRSLSVSDTPLERLDDMHQLYEIDDDSCIDLFTRGRPPATVGELVGNDYCLGRCASPAIYNSGE